MKRTFSAPMYIVSGFLILFLSSFTATALPHPFIRPKSASFTEQQITPTSDETLAARCAQRQYLPCFAEVSGHSDEITTVHLENFVVKIFLWLAKTTKTKNTLIDSG